MAALRHQGGGVGHHRSREERAQAAALAVDIRPDRPLEPLGGDGHGAPLLGEVGHDPLARVGGGGGAPVGDVVEQRGVLVVADGADDGCEAVGDHADERLVAEGQEVLDGAAAAGDHDDVDVAHGVELADRGGHLGDRARALHGDPPDLEVDRGPTASGVLDHVVLGLAGPPADEADPAGRKGSGRLRAASKRPSARSTDLRCSSRARSSPTPTARTWRPSS